jgi:mono/diheme cytochrome c family protein
MKVSFYNRSTPVLRGATTVLAATFVVACGPADQRAAVASPDGAAATIERYCSDCHNPDDLAGGLSFRHLDAAHVSADPKTWERIVRKLRTHTMPPLDARRPDAATYASLTTWLEASLDRTAKPYPGPPTLRRLNRAEYANEIRDLLGLEVDVTDLLPPDDSAFGFDNNGSLLVFSPTLLERYLTAADRVSALAVGDPETAVGAKTYQVKGDQSQALHLEGLPLGTVGGLAADHTFPLTGDYDFAITLLRNNLEVIRGLEFPHQLEIAVDGERVFLAEVGGSADADRPGSTVTEQSDFTDARLRVRAPITAGPHHVTATFVRKIGEGTNRLKPFDRSSAGTYDSTGRPHVETLTITGPFEPVGPGDTPSRRRIFTCKPVDTNDETRCAREIVAGLARRAYRRPVDDADLARLMPFYEQGRARGTFDTGIQLALRRILASPSFAFRVETEPADMAPGGSYYVSDVELASRLSFFIWSSGPDDELLGIAEQKKLHDPKVLEAQVRRMLTDPKASAFVENFAGQWLHLRNLENINPNSDLFPDFDNDLRQAFRREAELFFASILKEDRSILDLMTGDYTFVNERLARHYGIPNIYGSNFRRVALGPEFAARRGLLGKGGVLMATSHADRTAPTLRGKWILENLVGAPPPPPPGNVPALETKPGTGPQTIRERMEMHRANPTCASCHQLLDPLGFALENYDAVGAWRTVEAGRAVDASGRVADGATVDGVAELRQALLREPEIFAGTFTERLMTYALGRGIQYYDMPVVRAILRDAKKDEYKFSSIVLGIVESVPFRMGAKAAAPDGEEILTKESR